VEILPMASDRKMLRKDLFPRFPFELWDLIMQTPEKPPVPGERQGPIHTAIVNELIALTPEWWNAVTLIVSVAAQEGIESMPHEIGSPEGHREPITPSDRLLDLTRQLFRLFQEYGQPWDQLVYKVSLDAEGDRNWQCTFRHIASNSKPRTPLHSGVVRFEP
jgi:hypothetical protein